MEKVLNQILSELQSLNNRVGNLEERLIKVENTVIRIEHSHGESLGALLDGYNQNAEILDRHTEQLDRIEGKIEMLDKTKANKRKAK